MRPLRYLASVLAIVLLTACATSPLGKGIQAGVATKQGVETAMREVIRLYCAKIQGDQVVSVPGPDCTPRISKADWDKSAAAYAKYEALQKAYTDSLIAWDKVKTSANDARVKTALAQLRPQMENAADILCTFQSSSSTLASVCTGMGR